MSSNGAMGYFEVVNSLAPRFTNAVENDLVIYTSSNSQRLLIGTRQNDSAQILIDNSNLMIDAHVVPKSNVAYDLGSENSRFRDLYLSGQTIYLGQTKISLNNSNSSNIEFRDITTNALRTVVTKEVQIGEIAENGEATIIRKNETGAITFVNINSNNQATSSVLVGGTSRAAGREFVFTPTNDSNYLVEGFNTVNPTISIVPGFTYAFKFLLSNNNIPLILRETIDGVSVSNDFTYVAENGTETVGSNANTGHSDGILYWTVPSTIPRSSVVYQATTKSSAYGTITIERFGSELAEGVFYKTGGNLDGPILAAQDSINAPTYAWANDTDSGMYRDNVGTVGISCDATSVMTLHKDLITAKASLLTANLATLGTFRIGDSPDSSSLGALGSSKSQGGLVTPNTSSGSVTFPIPFTKVPFVVATSFTSSSDYAYTVHITSVTQTGFSYVNKCIASGVVQASTEPFHYIALVI